MEFDTFVVGGGATGSEVAFELARAGAGRVGLAERHLLGGTCSHFGCIPTKVMLRAATLATNARRADRTGIRVADVEVDLLAVRERVRAVIDHGSGQGATPFIREGIEVFEQEARIIGPHEIELADGSTLTAASIVLTTGSEPILPPVPGLADGPLWTNVEAIWKPTTVPDSLAIVGGGAIGVEFAQIYARFGSRVTVVEAASHILPAEDEDAAASIAPALEADGIELLTDASIERATYGAKGWELLVGRQAIRAEELLVATGRRPTLAHHDLVAAGVEWTEEGAPVLDDVLRTTSPDIWAAGDVTGELLFTHVATYEAGVVVANLLGGHRARDYRVVPRVTFCDPEVASVGLTERAAREAGLDVRVGCSRIADNERSMIDDQGAGIVKIVADAQGRILGGHIVATQAGAMIHEIAAMMRGGVPLETGAATIHAYPTLSSSMQEAMRQAARLVPA